MGEVWPWIPKGVLFPPPYSFPYKSSVPPLGTPVDESMNMWRGCSSLPEAHGGLQTGLSFILAPRPQSS